MLGHWFVIAVTETDGGLDGVNVLGRLGWTRPLTLLFQVMPLFFLVGGYANATSMQRHRAAGGDAIGWVLHRYRRILVPSTALLATVVAAAVVARAFGVDAETAGTGAWLATVPLWFLAVYLAVIAVAPITFAAHVRWGLAVPVVGAVVVAGTDVARFAFGRPAFSEGNLVLAWAAIHQLGYAWQDGRLPARWRLGAALALGGAVTLAALTVVGPYPVSMVRVPGATVQNTDPPTLALVAFAVTQVGSVLAVRDRADAWLRHRRRWSAVSRIQSIVLTLFLWHMAAAAVAAAVLYGTGLLGTPPPDSSRWLVLRVPWVATCSAVLAGFVVLFGPVERATRHGPRGRRVEGAAAAIAVIGIVCVLAGIFVLARAGSGSHGPASLPTDALVPYAIGVALAGWAISRGREVDEERAS